MCLVISPTVCPPKFLVNNSNILRIKKEIFKHVREFFLVSIKELILNMNFNNACRGSFLIIVLCEVAFGSNRKATMTWFLRRERILKRVMIYMIKPSRWRLRATLRELLPCPSKIASFWWEILILLSIPMSFLEFKALIHSHLIDISCFCAYKGSKWGGRLPFKLFYCLCILFLFS